MRSIPSYKNLGLKHEAYIVCSQKHYQYFRQVAQHMHDHGVLAGILNYEDENAFTDKAKRNLRNSYHVIFMLADGIVEQSIENAQKPNLFLQIYGYVNKYNPLSISCVSVDGYHIRSGLTLPDAMRGFDGLHRKPYRTDDAAFVAADLCKELRCRFSLDRRDKLNHLQKNGVAQHLEYYKAVLRHCIHSILACVYIFYVLLNWQPASQEVLSAMDGLQISLLVLFMLAIMTVLFRSAALKSCMSKLHMTTTTVAGKQKSDKRHRVQRWILFLYFLAHVFVLIVLFALFRVINPAQQLPLAFVLTLWHLLLNISVLIESLIMKKKLESCASYLGAAGFFLRYRRISSRIRVAAVLLIEIVVFLSVQITTMG